MGKSNKAKQAFIDKRMGELKDSGINPSIIRVSQEWSKSSERMQDMFKGIRADIPTRYESNHSDYDDVG